MQAVSLLTQHVQLMARYNQWMNEKAYDTAAQLTAAQLAENRGAFFGSVLGTLNHIVVADTVWLQRFAQGLPQFTMLEAVSRLPTPTALDAEVFGELALLRERRALLDNTILAFAGAVTEQDLASPVVYRNMKGVQSTRQLFGLLMHFFNHETHHRGQLTTLLTQYGLDVGVTDLLVLTPEL